MDPCGESGSLVHRNNTSAKTRREQIDEANADLDQTAAVTTGILQICFGSILLIMGVASVVLGSMFRSSAVWGALIFPLATGIVGFRSNIEKTITKLAYTLMSSTSAILSIILVVYDCIAIILQQQTCDIDYKDYYADYATYECHYNEYVVALHGCAAVIAFMEMVVAIAAATCGCCGCFCAETTFDNTQEDVAEEGSLLASADVYRQPEHLHCA